MGQNSVIQYSGLVWEKFDFIDFTWTAGNLTKLEYKYKDLLVATVTLTYDVDDNILTVTRS